MNNLLKNEVFGVLISIIAFNIGIYLYKKFKIAILNPLLISIGIIISFLLIFNISFETFNIGGKILHFYLGPATVILAVPLYKKIHLLKKHFFSILAGILSGSITSIISVILLGKIFNLDSEILLSLIPKSITTPIGIELSSNIGGNSSITVAAIALTGITGAIVAPSVCKIFKIKEKIAKGIAIGTASHAIGTSKALEMGEEEGAMSSLSIGLTGLITVLITPILIKLFL